MEVTAEDIAAGDPSAVDERHPIALAVCRALQLPAPWSHLSYVRVADDWFSVQSGNFYESYDLPPDTPEWIKALTAGQPVEPFVFTFSTSWGQ